MTGLRAGAFLWSYTDGISAAVVASSPASSRFFSAAIPPLHGQPLRPASGHRIELCVYVDDLDAMTERARAWGAPVLLEPTAQPWGERVAYVADPDGNLVMLVQ